MTQWISFKILNQPECKKNKEIYLKYFYWRFEIIRVGLAIDYELDCHQRFEELPEEPKSGINTLLGDYLIEKHADRG